jgi:hypothetical protein
LCWVVASGSRAGKEKEGAAHVSPVEKRHGMSTSEQEPIDADEEYSIMDSADCCGAQLSVTRNITVNDHRDTMPI